MESSFGKRVKEFRQFKNMSQTAFAEQCGLTQGNIAHMENGTEPKQSNISKLVEGFEDLNAYWLLAGVGPMLRDGRVFTAVPMPATTPEPPKPTGAVAVRAGIVEHADTVLLLSETEQKLVEAEKELTGVKTENQQLVERLQDAKEEILWLRGKSTPSSYAAAPEVEPLKMRRWHEVVSEAPTTGGKQLFMDTTGPASDRLAA